MGHLNKTFVYYTCTWNADSYGLIGFHIRGRLFTKQKPTCNLGMLLMSTSKCEEPNRSKSPFLTHLSHGLLQHWRWIVNSVL